MATAASILNDCIVTVAGGGADTGLNNPTFGTPITIDVAKVTVSGTVPIADHAGGQTPYEMPRPTGGDSETITVETILGESDLADMSGLTDLITSGDHQLLELAITAPTGWGMTAKILLDNAETEWTGPSTFKFGGDTIEAPVWA